MLLINHSSMKVAELKYIQVNNWNWSAFTGVNVNVHEEEKSLIHLCQVMCLYYRVFLGMSKPLSCKSL